MTFILYDLNTISFSIIIFNFNNYICYHQYYISHHIKIKCPIIEESYIIELYITDLHLFNYITLYI